MIAIVPNGDKRCAIYVVAQKGLVSVVAKTYCNAEINAAQGVYQLHESALNCPTCKAAIERSKTQW